MDAWFSDLYERSYALLYRIGRMFLGYDPAREALIEDQIQEAFLRAWQKRERLRRHPNPDGWIFECFRKCLMNACRKRSREYRRRASTSFPAACGADMAAAQSTPDEYASGREQVELLRRLLGPEDAELFLRYCVWGEKAADLAAERNVSEQSLRMRLSRLRKKILRHRELFSCVAFCCLVGFRRGG